MENLKQNLIQIGEIKNLKSYWEPDEKILYLERQETPGVFIPIYKGELFHLMRVLLRVAQKGFYRRKK